MNELGPRLVENGRPEKRAYFTRYALAKEWHARIWESLPGPYARVITRPVVGGFVVRWWT